MSTGVLGDLGPAKVIIDPDGSSPVDLGDVLGTIEFKDEPKYKEIKVEAQGESLVDAVFTGRECSLTVPLTRSQLDTLAAVIPGATVASAVMSVANKVGSAMYAAAKKITLKRIVDGVVSTAEADWLTIYKAFPIAKSDFKWDASNQRVCDVTFLCFVSQETESLNKIWAVGE